MGVARSFYAMVGKRISSVHFFLGLDAIVIASEERRFEVSAAEILAEIAALALEGPCDSFPGRDHDSILYPKKPVG